MLFWKNGISLLLTLLEQMDIILLNLDEDRSAKAAAGDNIPDLKTTFRQKFH